MIRHYETLTRRPIDLTDLGPKERKALQRVFNEYKKNPKWGRFSTLWQKELDGALRGTSVRARIRHPVYRVAQDLEMRLGIAQGVVAPPDYRDYIVDWIEVRFGSRYNFCKKTGIREAFLSQVLSGKKDFSMAKLREVAEALGLRIELSPEGPMRTAVA
ncbi:MAG: helix-turn-helix transcriptional regulator [Acidobacteria bacterium]|nr:helix-turn-helix transcriptional regulator [Acidobacteriota bacterium]